MNRNSVWRYLLVLAVLVFGLIYAAPNLYTPDPAVQVSGQSTGQAVGPAVLDDMEKALRQAGIEFFGEHVEDNTAMVRLRSTEAQLRAKEALQDVMGPNFVVALNLASTTPDWLGSFGAEPMKLGLDLSGGVHFLLQVDTDAVIGKYLESQANEMKKGFREAQARYRDVTIEEGGITAVFPREEWREAAEQVVRNDFQDFTWDSSREGERFVLRLNPLESLIDEKVDYAVTQNLTTLRNRVNELGVSEPVVQRQGRSRIIVQLPGVQDTATAKRIIGKTANLEFRLEAEEPGGPNAEEFEFRDPNARPRTAWLEEDVVITGDRVTSASTGFDQNNQPQVNIRLDSQGGQAMNYATRNNIGRNLGVLFIETRTRLKERPDGEGGTETVAIQHQDKRIISLATIRSALGVSFRITGLSTPAEASELALLLRSGALAAPMYFVQESTIGPSLGAKNIAQGVDSVQIGLLLVVIFMLVIYRIFGIIANLALGFNLVLLVAVMSLLGATLTLPGIAGIVLTVGMAVDANVLIFSRIKEEMKNGLSPQAAIDAGYNRAFVSIVDANLTTLIVAVILYSIGTGPVQGFAVVLSIGILTSMFTAIVGTRLLVNLLFGGRNVKTLWI